jgi:hypothetical protein
MIKRYVFVAVLVMGLAATARAQDLQVKSGSGAGDVFAAQNTNTGGNDVIAVHGLSLPQPYFGIGGTFEGGWHGVNGFAQLSGTGSRIGVYGFAGGGASGNYGVYGAATGTSAYAGYFSGNVYTTGTYTSSDAKLKLNIQDLPDGALGQVLRLKARTYRYRTVEFPKMGLPEGDQIGLVAQEVQAVFPQIVKQVTAPQDEHGKAQETFLGVDYAKLIPVLVKAVQEQQGQIEALKAQIARLK